MNKNDQTLNDDFAMDLDHEFDGDATLTATTDSSDYAFELQNDPDDLSMSDLDAEESSVITEKPVIPVIIDYSKIRGSKSVSNALTNTRTKGVMSVVNTSKYGKRVSLSKELADKLNRPASIQVGFADNQLIIGENIPHDTSNRYKMSYKDKSGCNVYASALVDEITKEYNLDFNSRTTITFPKAEYAEIDGYPVAVIDIPLSKK